MISLTHDFWMELVRLGVTRQVRWLSKQLFKNILFNCLKQSGHQNLMERLLERM